MDRARRPQTGQGALAGIGTGIGTAFHRGLAYGRMGTWHRSRPWAPLMPVAVGLVTGERLPLLTWIGIALAFPAIWLVSTAAEPVDVSGRPHRAGEGVTDGLLAGSASA